MPHVDSGIRFGVTVKDSYGYTLKQDTLPWYSIRTELQSGQTYRSGPAI